MSLPDARSTSLSVLRLADTSLPTEHGTFRMTAYRDDLGQEHVALSLGIHDADADPEPGGASDQRLVELYPPLVRVHSECLTGDALGSRRCDCGEQLQEALRRIAAEGRGVLVYVRGHEGRGIGLAEKLRAYALQDAGVDTVDANLQLGHPVDGRSYEQSVAILRDLGVDRLRLLSSNPSKEQALTALGLEVTRREPIVIPPRPENEQYLRTKQERMGHDRSALDAWSRLLEGEVSGTSELAQRYEVLARARHDGEPLVIAQLGQSLDGFIASRTGDARFVTGDEDREHLHRLRALVDAVLVGGATAAADDSQLTVRAVTGPHPVRVVLDPRGVLPLTARLLTDGAAPTLWVVGPRAFGQGEPTGLAEHVSVVRWPTDQMDPAAVLELLSARGLRRVLVEGGGRLVSSYVRAGLVDLLYLSTAPLVIGDGVRGLSLEGADLLSDALRPPARRWILGQDVVTELDLRALRAR